jgi:hypothetical protein
MNQPRPEDTVKPPWHFWLIGVLALLWNSFGAFDYVMTETRNASYMSTFTPEQLTYFYTFPAWAVAIWALGVWSAVLASVLLLLRRRLAVPVFAMSLAAMVTSYIHNYVLTDGFKVMGGAGALAFSGVIFLIGAALLIYTHKLSQRNVLR